jgi:hypothetical protein
VEKSIGAMMDFEYPDLLEISTGFPAFTIPFAIPAGKIYESGLDLFTKRVCKDFLTWQLADRQLSLQDKIIHPVKTMACKSAQEICTVGESLHWQAFSRFSPILSTDLSTENVDKP